MNNPAQLLDTIDETLEELYVMRDAYNRMAEQIKQYQNSALEQLEKLGLSTRETEYGVFTVSQQTSLLLDEKRLRKLLKKKGIRIQEAFDRVVSYNLNQQKLLELVRDGKITKKQLDSITQLKQGAKYIRRTAPRKENVVAELKEAKKSRSTR